MDEYIDVKIDVFEHTGQHARVRRTLTITTLIDEIFREFNDITADEPGKYAIYLKGVDRPLKTESTLIQLDIQPQDELVFDYVRQTIRKMLEPHQYAFLTEETTGKSFDIQWQPAVIGRPTNEVDHNIVLAVNVQLLPDGMTISRKHAQITFYGNKYFIEALAEENPLILNGKELPLNAVREIKNGDRLLFGRRKVPMVFTTQKQPSVSKESQPRITPQPVPPASTPVSTPTPVGEPVSQPRVESIPQDVWAGATRLTSGAELGVAYLIFLQSTNPANIGKQIELSTYPCILGREMPLLSSEGEVSRRHAEINFDVATKKFYITDLNSTNGVSVDGALLEPNRPREIGPGSKIGLGQKVLMRLEV